MLHLILKFSSLPVSCQFFLLFVSINPLLLLIPFRLGSRDHMKYSIWSEKVKSRIVSWYKIASIHGQDYVCAAVFMCFRIVAILSLVIVYFF